MTHEPLQIAEIHDAVFRGVEFDAPVVNDARRGDLGSEKIAEVVEPAREILPKIGSRFDFVSVESARPLFDEIDFVLRAVPIVEEARRVVVPGESALVKFSDHEVFEKIAAQRMRLELGSVLGADEPARQPGVAEIKFRALDDALADVSKKRRQAEDYVRGLENRRPRLNRRQRNADGVRERARVELASDRSGTEAHEIFERGEMPQLFEAAQVALDVGLVVVGKNVARRQNAAPDARIAAVEDQLLLRRGDASLSELLQRERRQLQYGGASGERLRNALHQQKIAAAGKDDAARRLFVHDHLRGGKKLGEALRLVHDHASGGVRLQKRARVGFDEPSRPRIFEIEVGEARENAFAQRGFSGLARSRQREYGIGFAEATDFRGDFAGDKGQGFHEKLKYYFRFSRQAETFPAKGISGGENIPVFVPAASDPRKTKFRRAASARSRGGAGI